jgi:hypothetical protein
VTDRAAGAAGPIAERPAQRRRRPRVDELRRERRAGALYRTGWQRQPGRPRRCGIERAQLERSRVGSAVVERERAHVALAVREGGDGGDVDVRQEVVLERLEAAAMSLDARLHPLGAVRAGDPRDDGVAGGGERRARR